MPNKGAILRALIDKGEHFVCGDTYSALTGRIAQHVGFPAVYLGGHACSAFHYAVPDNGVFSQVEQIEQASRIANVLDIPLIADADTLGETVADAYHFTRRYIQQGIAGFHVEDERNPKHSKHVNGLWSIADQQARIDAARRAQKDSGQDFVIIARCDELYPSERRRRRHRQSCDEAREARAMPISKPAPMWCSIRRSPAPVPDLIKVVRIGKHPVSTMGFSCAGHGLQHGDRRLGDGGGEPHQDDARADERTGQVQSPPTMNFPEKYVLIDHPLYDGLISKSGRTRPGRQSRGPTTHLEQRH